MELSLRSILWILASFCCSYILPAYAQQVAVISPQQIAQQCARVNCSCSSLPRNDWQGACMQQQQHITQQCLSAQGKITDYCRWQGAYAYPAALASKSEKRLKVNSEQQAEAANKYISSRIWSITQDINSASTFYQTARFSAHITTLKKLDKQVLSLIAQVPPLLEFYRLEEEDDLLEEQQNQVLSLLSQVAAIYQQWLQDPAFSSSKTHKRAIRYHGNLQEYLGRWHESRKQFELAHRHYLLAGDIAKQLQVLTVGKQGKQRFVDYYRNQAASRWSRSADMGVRWGSPVMASGLAAKANKLWSSADKAKPADLAKVNADAVALQ